MCKKLVYVEFDKCSGKAPWKLYEEWLNWNNCTAWWGKDRFPQIRVVRSVHLANTCLPERTLEILEYIIIYVNHSSSKLLQGETENFSWSIPLKFTAEVFCWIYHWSIPLKFPAEVFPWIYRWSILGNSSLVLLASLSETEVFWLNTYYRIH